MKILTKSANRDKKIATSVQKHFKQAIVFKDKESGIIGVLFKSKSGFIFQVLTDQKKVEILERN